MVKVCCGRYNVRHKRNLRAESTDADIAIDVPATAKQTDVGNPETVKPESAAVQQTTATATTSSGESFAGSDGILKDDGLDWSPLVQVN